MGTTRPRRNPCPIACRRKCLAQHNWRPRAAADEQWPHRMQPWIRESDHRDCNERARRRSQLRSSPAQSARRSHHQGEHGMPQGHLVSQSRPRGHPIHLWRQIPDHRPSLCSRCTRCAGRRVANQQKPNFHKPLTKWHLQHIDSSRMEQRNMHIQPAIGGIAFALTSQRRVAEKPVDGQSVTADAQPRNGTERNGCNQ